MTTEERKPLSRVEGLRLDEMTGNEKLLATIQSTYGRPPNSFTTLGRVPALLDAVGQLSLVVLAAGEVDVETKWLVANVASRAAGCSYCSAHTGFHSVKTGGAPPEKVAAVWEFESSPIFSDAERAALRLALVASVVPNQATAAHFDELRAHFSDTGIVEIVAVISLFGFMNRWNDTMATELEDPEHDFAQRHMAASGWRPKPRDAERGDARQ
ncbi:MAG: carboxymuconolactone decarboxylase family protein [Acidimicrobiales bacterium]